MSEENINVNATKNETIATQNGSNVGANTNDVNKMFKNRRRKEKIKKYLKRGAIIGGILALYFYSKLKGSAPEEQKSFDFDENKVEYGTVSVTVAGDGVITANSIYTIVPKVTGEILQDYVIANSDVKKGEILYVIDSKDVNSTINQASLGVKQTDLSISQAQQSYDSILKQINDLKIYATADGYIENLILSEGSYVGAMTPVCDINEKNVYEVVLQYRTATAKDIMIGDRVSVFFLDYIYYVDGKVTKVSDSTSLNNMGAQVTEVTVEVETTGYSVQNAKVEGTIFLGNGTQIASINNSILTAKNSTVVVSDSTGTVKELYVENGSYVHKGDLIATLENSNLNTQLDSAKLSIDNALLAKKNAQNSLSGTRQQLDNYYITSPIDGRIVYKNYKKGDVISTYQQNASGIMAIVADVSVMKFEMQIDELDITKIKLGQEVEVKIEALDNKIFEGKVSNINIIGNNIGGTTNYTIEVELPGNDEIYSGMTVDAKVAVIEKENVLRVPLTAIRKGDVVYKKSADELYQDSDTDVPQGYEKIKVEMGINNSDYVEIISGLSSGDIVLTDKVKESGTFSMENLTTMMMEN